jgi:hypothetical protein
MEYWNPDSLAIFDPTIGLFVSFFAGAGVESSGCIVLCNHAGPFER